MGPDCVVVLAPALDRALRIGQAGEPVLVQAFVSEAAVEALDVSILDRLAGGDEEQLEPALVGPDIEGADDPGTRERGVDFNGRALAGEVIDDREAAKLAAVTKRMTTLTDGRSA